MKYILIFLVVTMISGCSVISGYYEADPLFKQQSDLLDDEVDIVDVNKLKARVNAATTPLLRNQLIEELLTISDRSCARHQASIIATVNTWNVSTGTISTLLSAVATVTGGESAKAALSAGAALTNNQDTHSKKWVNIGYGRKADHSTPPAQIRTYATNVYGSYLEYLA